MFDYMAKTQKEVENKKFDQNNQGWCCCSCKIILPICLFLIVATLSILAPVSAVCKVPTTAPAPTPCVTKTPVFSVIDCAALHQSPWISPQNGKINVGFAVILDLLAFFTLLLLSRFFDAFERDDTTATIKIEHFDRITQ